MRRFLALLLLILVAAAVGWWFYGDDVTWKSLLEQEQALRTAVQEHPVVSLAIGFVVYVMTSLIPGTTGKAILYGWLFGFWAALFIVSLALTIAAVISFLLGRYLLREYVVRRFAGWIDRVDNAVTREGPFYLITLRLLHAPYTLINYSSGATAMTTWTFSWTTLVGMLPGNLVFVLAGSRLPTLKHLTEKGIWSLVDLRLFAVLSVMALLPVVSRWLLHWYRGGEPIQPDSSGEGAVE